MPTLYTIDGGPGKGPLLLIFGGLMEVLCLLYMDSRSSWELTSSGQAWKEKMEAHTGSFPGPGVEVATYFFHHNLLARTWSSGPTHLPGRLRNIV